MSGYVRNNWYPFAWASELEAGPLGRRLLGDPVMAFRTEDGGLAALADRCCHKFLPLSMGRVRGECIECGYHGLQFDATGACRKIPGQRTVPANIRVRAYPVAERIGLIWIWTGDPRLADPSRLFDLPRHGDPAWGVNHGPYTHVEAHYQHLTDNLLDPAHVSFVHPTTLGSSAMEDIPVETRQTGDTVEVARWTLGRRPVAIFEQFLEIEGAVDRWQYYVFHPPAINIVDFGIGPVGMGHADSDRAQGTRIFSCHFLAPESDRSTHYFWMQLRNFAVDDPAVSARMTEQFVIAFEEDRGILEAVQQAQDEAGRAPSVRLAIDNGPNRSRRIVERLIRRERQAAEAAAQ